MRSVRPPSGRCPLPAAHAADYSLERTSEDGHRWCSVVVEAEGTIVFHAGDTVSYDGFAELIRPVDLACVPGRSDNCSHGPSDDVVHHG